MPSMAPMTVYQGSKDMKSYEGSKSDMKADKRMKAKEGSKRDDAADRRAASKTIVGKGVKVNRVKSQTPFGGDDISGEA